jgi:hypothetical protein
MKTLLCLFASAAAVLAADPAPESVGQVLDRQLAGVESEMVKLAEALPAEKYGFAPTDGEFQGVRTFAQQASHTAAVVYWMAAISLGEKNPSEVGAGENGPATVKTKEQIVQYLKDAFAYGHKAMKAITAENVTAPVANPFGDGTRARLWVANLAIWHSYDHYGQMVVYSRMNGVAPPR